MVVVGEVAVAPLVGQVLWPTTVSEVTRRHILHQLCNRGQDIPSSERYWKYWKYCTEQSKRPVL